MDLQNKSAFISIVGQANVGKSSLLNCILGQKISIVSNKPQTTRTKIMGILTKKNIQLVFVDTPGFHKPKNVLGQHMVNKAQESLEDVDIIMLVVDSTCEKIKNNELKIIEKIKSKNLKSILVFNKIDLVKNKSDLIKKIKNFSDIYNFEAVILCSAKENYGISDIINELTKLSESGEHFFDDDDITDQSERFLVSEIVREKLLKLLDEEVPHGIAVYVENMEKKSNIIDIQFVIYCEKSSHKGIIIGKKGNVLKKVGIEARKDIENLLRRRVNLKLWVKVKNDWRDKENLVMPFVYEGEK